MSVSEYAGKPVPTKLLVNIPRLVASYYTGKPDTGDPGQRVSFGTSGHRGSALKGSFNEDHLRAICQAIAETRKLNGIHGPLFLGKDTHALSEPALITAIEVLAANDVTIMIDQDLEYTPTPVISHAIVSYNRGRKAGMADGIIITPSHNPPDDGGIKYNPPNGGPADTAITQVIQDRANEILVNGMREIRHMPYGRALKNSTTHRYDFITPYISDLKSVVNMASISASGLKIGVDPMGGAGIAFWQPMAEMYDLNLSLVNDRVDPSFSFMSVDRDGKIRMDCSSPYAMARLIDLKDQYDIAFGNDPDYDRHGIVSSKGGLLNPNHYLAVSINYLFKNRPAWKKTTAIGKTLVSSAMIDRVAAGLGRTLCEVPVGFKWFVNGLSDGSYGFGGEESAGASFLKTDGSVWTTDKDGFIMDLLAAEMVAETGKDPSVLYAELESLYGSPVYERIDAPADLGERTALKNIQVSKIKAEKLAGEVIRERLTHAPANNAPIGGIKIQTENGWFAARPSGTEDIYKIYAESFIGSEHLQLILNEARELVTQILKDETKKS